MTEVSLDELRKVVALSDLPDEQLNWILDHSELCEFNDGDLIVKYGEPAEVMWIALCGKISFYMYTNGRQVYYFTFENNDLTGGMGGLLPYSRMVTYPGYSYAVGKVRLLRMHKRHFPALEQINPDFIQRLIGYMTERARVFATRRLQQEKVEALGNLAAGIAHELNNPAAAIRNISDELHNRMERNLSYTTELIALQLQPEHFRKLQELIDQKSTTFLNKSGKSIMQRMNDQDEMEDWLLNIGIDNREAAETFSEFGITAAEMENVLEEVGKEPFLKLVPWLENIVSCRKLLIDLGDASGRISSLVGSIKSHVHMDQSTDIQTTDLHTDLENTLTLLGFKLRAKNISVVKNYSPDLPPVPAYVGELNQVWTNLIDNAIAAMDKNGEITIETRFDERNATVSIIDNGPGIPKEIQSRIFDPFFTTKKVGEGSGIGLDIVSRVVNRHNGEINLKSCPGRTEFSICLPLVFKETAAPIES